MTGRTTHVSPIEADLEGSRLRVREMELAETGLRIAYFHEASDDHLRTLGVDRALLPTPAAWRDAYERDFARPIEERDSFCLVWELDEVVVGFSSTDQITFGEQAFMHLHILDRGHRRSGMGTVFVRMSALVYFEALHLTRLFCQPNAFNVAPNRTLQRAGFRYDFTRDGMAPSSINFPQPITRWVLTEPPSRAEFGA